MIERLAMQIMRLSRRERWLLLAGLLIVLPLGLAFAIAEPLAGQRLSAEERLAEARTQRDWFQARQAELAALPATATPASMEEQEVATNPVGLGGIEARLSEEGLRRRVVALAAPARGEVMIQLEEVSFTQLMQWIEAVEREAGYELGSLRLRRGSEAGVVNAELQLEPRS